MQKPNSQPDVTSCEGFIQKFYEFCSEYTKNEEAYDATERMHIREVGYRKYSNYESFKRFKNKKAAK